MPFGFKATADPHIYVAYNVMQAEVSSDDVSDIVIWMTVQMKDITKVIEMNALLLAHPPNLRYMKMIKTIDAM